MLIQSIKKQQMSNNGMNGASFHFDNINNNQNDIGNSLLIENSLLIKPNAYKSSSLNNNNHDDSNKLNGIDYFRNHDYNHNQLLSKHDALGLGNGGDFLTSLSRMNASSNLNSSADHEINNILNNSNLSRCSSSAIGMNGGADRFNPIINKFGGEVNTQPTGQSFGASSAQQGSQIRQSRPGSSLSASYGMSRMNPAGTGGAGGGNYPPTSLTSESFLAQDTNRQILLILVRLQQDTNSVLTRLNYLEANLMSLQNNLQGNRFENTINTNQGPSAFTLVNSPQSRAVSNGNRSGSMSFWRDLIKSIDWKTVTIAVLWPFIIRLVFFVIKKVRFVM